MRIAVTGGSGFLGQELVQALQSAGHQVINIDLVPSNLSEIEEHIVDLTRDYPKIKCDFCFHLASGAGGILFNQNEDIITYNDRMNKNVLLMCGDAPLVFISSVNVFEGLDNIYQTLSPITFYAKSKLSGEKFFNNNKKENLHIVRSTNIFGKSQINRFTKYGESHVIPDILNKINKDSDVLEVWGDGTQMRNFIHVRDLCNYLSGFLLGIFTSTAYHNICSSITISISELIEDLLNFSHKDKMIVYKDSYMQYEKIRIDHFIKDLYNIGAISTIEEGLLL
jgi:UDP-glucose 4-epimerase